MANSTCFGLRLLLVILRQLLREDEHAVERRAQLVRHVGQELRLVLRRQCQLFGLLLERGGRHDPSRASGARLPRSVRTAAWRFLLELVVGLQPLGRQGLRLGQQLFGPRRRGDGVHDHADAFGELVQERQVGLAEAIERRQLDDRFDVALEQHRQHHDVERWRRAQAGADVDVVTRDFAEQNAALFVGALADQSFAQPELPARAPCARGRRTSTPAAAAVARRPVC